MNLKARIRGLPGDLIDLIVSTAVQSTMWLTRVKPLHGRMHIMYDIHDAIYEHDDLVDELCALEHIAEVCNISVVYEVAIPLDSTTCVCLEEGVLPISTKNTVLFFHLA